MRFVVYLACGLAFLADVSHDYMLAFGVFYIPLVGTAIYHRDPRAVWWLAGIATVMVVIGSVIPQINPDVVDVVANRALSIAAIVATAGLIRHERSMRDQLVEQTRRAQAADRAKRQLFANLSHELRTPLATILGFADVLLRDARPQQHASLEHIRAGGQRLLATVDNLIDLAQLEDRTMRVRPVDPTALLRHAVDAALPQAWERKVTLRLTLPDMPVTPVMADVWALRRIIDNLLSNGIKFTGPGGSVTLSCSRNPAGEYSIMIEDTGSGMSTEVLRQLGEPFFQGDSGLARRFEGLGAGLALSLRLAAVMGGRLSFRSQPGVGTAVTIALPAATGDHGYASR